MSIIKPRPMTPKPERPPARGTSEWYALKREQANARAALRERKRDAQPHGQRQTKEKLRHGAVGSGNSRLKPFSSSSQAQLKRGAYVLAKEDWRAECVKRDGYHRCEWHDGAGNRCKRKASKHPHHKAGRAGDLLWDKRYFMAICEGATGHHNWIHFQEPKEAEKRGFIIRIRAKH